MKKIISVVGARPNFMKVAPLHKAFQKHKSVITHQICHTGQHYDKAMSDDFFHHLELPKPNYYLGVGSGSHAEQTAKIMIEFEKILLKNKPDLVIVVGDVNSTIACSLTAVKLGIKVAHIEAGLRSFDRTMPEEINRILTDSISDYLFVTEESAIKNLSKEGISSDKIFYVGNIMIDSLSSHLHKASKITLLRKLDLLPRQFVLVTLHRPSNVDEKEQLTNLIQFLNSIAEHRKIIFPIHPRTAKNIEKYKLNKTINPNLIFSEPMNYIDFLTLMKNAGLVITDSGGIQEETTYLGVQCLTLRPNTERPVTVELGTNHLTIDLNEAFEIAKNIFNGKIKEGIVPQYWDGKTSERITNILLSKLK